MKIDNSFDSLLVWTLKLALLSIACFILVKNIHVTIVHKTLDNRAFEVHHKVGTESYTDVYVKHSGSIHQHGGY